MSAISQKQVQKLLQKLSPQQIQMIKLLELPTIQLEQRIKQEIEENPVLEEEVNQEAKEEEEQKEEITMDDFLNDDTPGYRYHANNFSRDDKPYNVYITRGRSLSESLEEQIGFRNLSAGQETLAKYLIGSIEDDGYLRRELSSIADDIAFSLGVETTEEELEYILKEIQQLEPAGVGARTLQECLLLQLCNRPMTTPARKLAKKILTTYFTEFSKKHYEKLMARLGVTEDEFRDAIEEIISLSPKPGNLHNEGGSDALPYIIPDFILDNSNGEQELRLNSGTVPEVRVSRRYMEMMQEMAGQGGVAKREEDKETIQFVKSKIDSAKWFISAIKQRQDTLMRTMTEIYDYQREYFEDGDLSKLRPMILKDIADRTGLDVSTISRVVNSKYIQTHFGIIPLKQLFSEAMHTDSGAEVSSYEIKNILSECIREEDKRKPLTDEVLMDILNEKGYQIARRTVAKYREMLGIPVARLRKEI